MIEASVICDSISPQGKCLTTFKLRYPKFIHSEFMTHRVISRNASSSRAIPTAKLLEEVRSNAMDEVDDMLYWKNRKQHGNFVGWQQYRKMLQGEAIAQLPEEFLK